MLNISLHFYWKYKNIVIRFVKSVTQWSKMDETIDNKCDRKISEACDIMKLIRHLLFIVVQMQSKVHCMLFVAISVG